MGLYFPGGTSGTNNTGGFLTFPKNNVNSMTSNFTLMAWGIPRLNNATRSIISQGNLGWYFRLNSGKMEFLKSQSVSIATANTTATGNRWSHFAVTSGPSGVGAFYLNSVLDGRFSHAQTFAPTRTITGIGEEIDSGGTSQDYWLGVLAWVAGYTRALDIREINIAMKYPGAFQNVLAFLYPLYGISSPEPDLTKYRNHAILAGSPVPKFIGLNPPIQGMFNPTRLRRTSYVVPAVAPSPSTPSVPRTRKSRMLMGVGL